MTTLETLRTFTIENLPDLDTVTQGALELFAETKLPQIDFMRFKRPLVVGSVNGAAAGRILFADTDAVFADESSYLEKLNAVSDIDGAFLVSASGAKHSIEIARALQERGVETCLLTNNAHAPAREYIKEENVYVFPKNREPYTYNTSTYMGFFFAKTQEDPKELLEFIQREVAPLIPSDLSSYKAFCLVIPPHYYAMREMFLTKFDELFGPEIVGRVFTAEQMKHAKTVIESDKELFIIFNEKDAQYGLPENRLFIPLPSNADHAAMMAVGYYVIGQIQKQFPPFFKQHIAAYMDRASRAFNSTLSLIVE